MIKNYQIFQITLFLSVFSGNFALFFVDAVRFHVPSHHRCRVDIGVASDHGSRIEHAVTADFHVVAEHRAHLFQTCLDISVGRLDDHERLVTLDIGSDGSCTHVRFIAKNAVAHIVVMRDLYFVKEDHIFEFCRVADNGALADDRISADKCAVADLRVLINDAGTVEACRGGDFGRFCDPDVLAALLILVFRE